MEKKDFLSHIFIIFTIRYLFPFFKIATKMLIDRLKSLAETLKNDFIEEACGIKSTHRWLSDFNTEVSETRQYRGREILELLQNADDAKSPTVNVELDTEKGILKIINSGVNTLPFTYEGFESIMCPHLSPKKSFELIGHKGLGFRSILNWSDRIEIISGNIKASFSREIVKNFWDKEMAPYLKDVETFINEAKQQHREVPLAILALPEFSEFPDNNEYHTEITIYLGGNLINRAKKIDDIKKELLTFQPISLLFTHNIKTINIYIDSQLKFHFRNDILSEEGGIVVSRLNGKKWIKVFSKGSLTIEGNVYHYETAAAFEPEGYALNYPIYSFFPTDVVFHLPCILHASLELDNSRSTLIKDSDRNKKMMELLADNVYTLSEYIKKNLDVSWVPFRLMRHGDAYLSSRNYELQLFEFLNDKPGDFIPLAGGNYAAEDKFYYINDEFFEIVDAWKDYGRFFKNMRLKAPEELNFNSNGILPVDWKAVETFAADFRDMEILALFILALKKYSEERNENLNLKIFRDRKGDVITGKTLINTGEVVSYIPSFIHFEYISDDLFEALSRNMILPNISPDKERTMADQLSKVGEINATDINRVTRDYLLPKKSDFYLSDSYKEELIISTFKIFLQRSHNIEIGDQKVYLYSESPQNNWTYAKSLVMCDPLFPDGFDTKGFGYVYPPAQRAKFPEFLLPYAENDHLLIQRFYEKLGVNLFYIPKEVCLSEDWEYIQGLDINGEVKGKCNHKEARNLNFTEIIPVEFLQKLDLSSQLRLIIDSSYFEKLNERQEINWYLKSLKEPEVTDFNYATFLLQKLYKSLFQYYVLETGKWLPGFEQELDLPYPRSEAMRSFLLKMGAKARLSDFSPSEIYEAMNSKAEIWTDSYSASGVPNFYHIMKQALENIQEFKTIPEDISLKMLCRKGDTVELRNSREIFYSDRNLPDKIAGFLPMALMNRREGELSVERYFGCHPFSKVNFKVKVDNPNILLQKSFEQKMEILKPLLMASICENITVRNNSDKTELFNSYRNLLDRFSIIMVETAEYELPTEEEEYVKEQMLPNEIIISGNDVYLCSREDDIDSAMQDPGFIDAIVEALCVNLKLSIKENHDRFHRIFSANEVQRRYYIQNEIGEENWKIYAGAFGIAPHEVPFWRKVFKLNSIMVSDDLFIAAKREPVAALLGIPLNQVHEEIFRSLQLKKLLETRRIYEADFIRRKYDAIKDIPEKHRHFRNLYSDFLDREWLETAMNNDDIVYILNPDFDSFFRKEAKRRFGYVPSDNYLDAIMPQPLQRYFQRGLNEFYLSDEEKSLLYFEGYDDFFAEKNKLLTEEENEQTAKPAEDSVYKIINVELGNVTRKNSESKVNNHRNGHGGGKPMSDSQRKKLGDRAEDIVYKALKDDPNYKIGNIYSTHLNLTTGENKMGFDLEYIDISISDKTRYLEIKHSDGNTVVMSPNELRKAKENPEIYDLALVVGNDILILHSPFMESSEFQANPNDFTVTFNITRR